jgi:hypothetical protein
MDQINKTKKKTAVINVDRNSVELIPTKDEIKDDENGIGGGGFEQHEAERAAAKTAYNARLESPSKIVDNTHLNDFYGLTQFKVKWAASLHLLIKHIEKKDDFKNEFYHPLNYAYDGKINEFVSWVTRFNDKLTHYTDKKTIHIVGHSNLMKGGLKQIDKETGKNYLLKAVQQGITETNAWRLLINKNIDDIKIYKGIPKKIKGDPTWENSKMCNTELVDKAAADKAAADKAVADKAVADKAAADKAAADKDAADKKPDSSMWKMWEANEDRKLEEDQPKKQTGWW